jgi:hypothetical protein
MTNITRNILDFYKENESNSLYLKKLFTNTSNLGYYGPYAQNVVDTKWNGKDPYIGTIDEINTYIINEFGFRGEAYKDSDVVVSGCSITFGIGVPESGRWANLLSNKINKKVMNLGSPGASAESISTKTIQYCLNNKMPKQIFCLFPDFFRRMVVADKEFYKTKGNNWAEKQNHLEYVFCNPRVSVYDSNSFFMEVEDQKYIEDSVSPHQLIVDSINAIYALESFCSSNNIEFHWTTWDLSTALLMENLVKLKDFKLKNYTPFFPPKTEMQVGSFISKSCQSNHKSDFINNVCWGVGSDYSIVNSKKVTNTAHPGIHFHEHFADFFYNLSKQSNEEHNKD